MTSPGEVRKKTLSLDREELAWAAGFFDGEGSVCLRRRRSWMELWFQVGQSEPTTLERFRRALGGIGGIGGPWNVKRGTLPQYRFDLRGYPNVQAGIAMLWNFLSEPKRKQAYTAMAECRAYVQNKALYAPGRAKITLKQAADIRARHAIAKMGRKRVVPGWLKREANEVGVSVNTIKTLVAGRGHHEERRAP